MECGPRAVRDTQHTVNTPQAQALKAWMTILLQLQPPCLQIDSDSSLTGTHQSLSSPLRVETRNRNPFPFPPPTTHPSTHRQCRPSRIPMGASILHVDEICCGLKVAKVSDKKHDDAMTCSQLGGKTGFTHSRLSARSLTMSSLKHSSAIWVKMMPNILAVDIVMMNG